MYLMYYLESSYIIRNAGSHVLVICYVYFSLKEIVLSESSSTTNL